MKKNHAGARSKAQLKKISGDLDRLADSVASCQPLFESGEVVLVPMGDRWGIQVSSELIEALGTDAVLKFVTRDKTR
jgi:hypothetical protein